LKAVGLQKEILIFGSSDKLDLREISPSDEEEEGDGDAHDQADVDVQEDGAQERGHPNEGLRGRATREADKVPELNKDAEK